MQFRCPFEERGRQEGTIIEVVLGENQEERLDAIRTAYQQFYLRLESPAIRFIAPPSLLKRCSSNEDVRRHILPLQAEVIAVELDIRLHPFLPYQAKAYGAETMAKFAAQNSNLAWTARILNKVMLEGIPRPPLNTAEIGIWIEVHFAAHKGEQDPKLLFLDYMGGRQITLLSISPGNLVIQNDRGSLFASDNTIEEDPLKNRNCFSIVKTPFYPETFGRWSDKIELVVSREADFVKLSRKKRRDIRRRSNLVLKKGGVRVGDLEEDKQSTGVWVPEYRILRPPK